MRSIVFPRNRGRLRVAAIWLMIYAMTFSAPLQVAFANPMGGTVVAGSASIAAGGNNLTITQNSNRAIVNWQSFSIGQQEMTQFVQPSSQAAILNRVTGGDASAILGSMQSNGQVYLINPHGILFGPNATVNVGSLVVSTLDVDNGQFLRGGDLTFQGDSQAGVYNYGQLQALEGDVYLIAQNVANHGTIRAPQGTAGLLAGQSVTLIDDARPHLAVKADAKSLSNASVTNTGLIEAAQAELAVNGGNVYGLAINNTGTVRATGATERDGRIYLTAEGGDIESSGQLIARFGTRGGSAVVDAGAGRATVSGSIDVSGATGGEAQILGDQVELAGATVDASGREAGGRILVGGDFHGLGDTPTAQQTTVDADSLLTASAIEYGNGGDVVVWANDATHFAGSITARGGAAGGNGGFAEVSGKNTLGFYGQVDLSSVLGNNGTLLLDPINARLSTDPTGSNNINVGQLVAVLETDTDVLITTIGNGGQPGDILVQDDVYFDSNALLELRAHRHVLVEADMATTRGDVVLVAGWTPNPQGIFDSQNVGGVRVSDDFVTFDPRVGANTGNFGNNAGSGAGSVFLDAMEAGRPVNVVSGRGNVRAFGHNVIVKGGDNYGDHAMIGSLRGNTLVVAKQDVRVSGNGSPYMDSFGQIGVNTLEFDEAIGLPVTSNIRVIAGRDVKVIGNGSYAQIGNSGLQVRGDIDVTTGRNVRVASPEYYSRSQIGHLTPHGSGDISVLADRDVKVQAEDADALAIVGHLWRPDEVEIFGFSPSAALRGDIDVVAGSDLSITSEGYAFAVSQVGHRIESYGLEIIPTALDGPLGEVSFPGELNGELGGLLIRGDITTRSGGATEVRAGTPDDDAGQNESRIGHSVLGWNLGGFPTEFPLIGIDLEGPLPKPIVAPRVTPIMIHGNIDARARGEFRIEALGIAAEVDGGNLAQVGHYARQEGSTLRRLGDGLTSSVIDLCGDIQVRTRENLQIRSAGPTEFEPNLAQIGHRVRTSLRGSNVMARIGIYGDITTLADGPTRVVARGVHNESRIGHSALVRIQTTRQVEERIGNLFSLAELPVLFPEVRPRGSAVNADIRIAGHTTTLSGADLLVLAEGQRTTAQLGHDAVVRIRAGIGGQDTLVRLTGAVTGVAGEDILIRAAGRSSSAQVGHSATVRSRGGGGGDVPEFLPATNGLETLGVQELGEGGPIGRDGGLQVTTRGPITLLAGNDITATSEARRADVRIGHSIFVPGCFPRGDFLAHGDIRIATLAGDVQLDARRGNVSVGHDVPALDLCCLLGEFEPEFDEIELRQLENEGPGDGAVWFPRLTGRACGDIIILAGGQALNTGGIDGGDIVVVGSNGKVHVGHGDDGHLYDQLRGDIVMVADSDFVLAGNERDRARIGHGGFLGFALDHRGAIVLAWDQLIPTSDTDGRFYMGSDSVIDSKQRAFGPAGQYVINPQNPVILIGTRRGPFNGPPLLTGDGVPVNVIEDGAVINGIPFDSGLPLGERNTALLPWFRGWNINTEFQNTTSEKWGYSFFNVVGNPSLDQLLLSGKLDLNLGTLSSTYDSPFTFYYLETTPTPIYDWNFFHEIPYWVDGVGEGGSIVNYVPRDEDELTGESNYQAFGL